MLDFFLLKYIGGKTQWRPKRTADWTQKKKEKKAFCQVFITWSEKHYFTERTLLEWHSGQMPSTSLCQWHTTAAEHRKLKCKASSVCMK